MSTELITEHLDLWTSAVTYNNGKGRGNNGEPELTGIKKLRELILELAVRGKLVPQDPEDEPASKLLERIEEEKWRLYKEGKIKKPKKLPRVSEGEKPCEVPDGWLWDRIGNYTYLEMGQSPKSQYYNQEGKGVPFFQGKADFGGLYPTTRYWCTDPIKMALPGDILLSVRAPVGPTNISNIEACIGRGLCAVRPLSQASKMMVLYTLQALRPRLEAQATGTTFSAVSREDIEWLPIPVPPVGEQQRIVKRIDVLMALCDRLEQQTTDQLSAHETLVDTLLDTLTRSQDAAELADNWARLAEHFNILFTTEHSIDRLEQTILQLAVMGRLVPQDPSDEPASKLLERIEEEKKRLYKVGKNKNSKKLPGIAEAEKPFSLPKGWALARLDDITEIQSGVAKGKKLAGVETVSVPYLRVANVQRAALELDDIKHIEVPRNELDSYLLRDRDLLITEGGDWDKVGRTAIWKGSIYPIIHQNHVFRARLVLAEQNERWLEKYLNSRFAREYFARSSKQTTNLASINKTQLQSCTIPIPPLQEQARIIEKLDELLAICEHLKSHFNEAGETQQRLAESIVKQAAA